MKVRVKETLVENFYGFHGIKRRYPGDEFTLTAIKDKEGKVISSVEAQFSSKWMEKVNKPGPRAKDKKDESLTSEEGGV